MPMWRSRFLWAALAAVSYLGAAALRLSPRPLSALGAVLGALVLLVGWRLCDPPRRGVDRVTAGARAAARAVAFGAALAVAALGSPAGAEFVAAERIGLGIAAVASLVALARIGSLGGIAAKKARASFAAAAFAGLLWAGAAALAITPVVTSRSEPPFDPLSLDYAAVAAALGTGGITLIAAYRVYAERRFELGVAERAAAALWLSVLALLVGVFAALMAVAPPERVVPSACLVGTVAVAASVVSAQPTFIARLLRGAASLTMLCAPVASIAVVVAYKAPTYAGLVMFVVAVVAALAGAASPHLARRLAPERGHWLTVLDKAIRAAKQPDPQQAITAVLVTIRDGLGPDSAPAALYRLASRDRVTVDRAGYLQIEELDVPQLLIDLAAEQPERVLATEALRYVEVQRPEVRDLVAWLDAHGGCFVALVHDEEVCVGVLLWPVAGRAAPLSAEETELARLLADHLGAVTGAAAQLQRSRTRELEAEQAVAAGRDREQALLDVIERQARRQRALAEVMARPARVASYSPAAHDALLRCDRLGEAGQPVAIIAPPGVDARPWLAVIHLASERSGGALLVLDGNMPADQPAERWQAAGTSPFEVAREGTLAVIDPDALPAETQRLCGAQLPADVGLALVVSSAAKLAELDEHLLARVRERVLALPSLAERAEDLRALSLHILARTGDRFRGRPYGLSLRAQQLLNDYEWPGNDAELEAVLLRAALACGDGDVVDAPELARAIGRAPVRAEGPLRNAR